MHQLSGVRPEPMSDLQGLLREFSDANNASSKLLVSGCELESVLDASIVPGALPNEVYLDSAAAPRTTKSRPTGDLRIQSSDSRPSSVFFSTADALCHSLLDINQLRALIETGVSVNCPIKEECRGTKRGGRERWDKLATASNTVNPFPDWRVRAAHSEGPNGASLHDPLSVLEIPDDEQVDVEFGTLLHCVAADTMLSNSKLVTTELITAKASVNARSSLGSTPLMRAAEHKHVGVAEILLASRANLEPTDNLGQSALAYAIQLSPQERPASMSAKAETTSRKLVELLLCNNVDPNSGMPRATLAPKSPSFEYISFTGDKSPSSSGDVEKAEVSQHLPIAPSVVPLLCAIRNDNAPAVRYLLENGASPNFLLEAVVSSCPAIIRDLLKAQADPAAVNGDGLGAMELALRRSTEQEDVTNMLRSALGRQNSQKILSRQSRTDSGIDDQPPSSSSLPSIHMISTPISPRTPNTPRSARKRKSIAGSQQLHGDGRQRPSIRSDPTHNNRRPSLSSNDSSRGSHHHPKRRPSVVSTCSSAGSQKTTNTNTKSSESGSLAGVRASSVESSPTLPSNSLRSNRSNILPPSSEHNQRQSDSLSKAVHMKTAAYHISHLFEEFQPLCRDLCRSKLFQALMFMSLLAALFIVDLWVLLDLNSGQGLDVILLCLLCLFVMEIMVQSIAHTKTYVGSFFFYMDVLGTISILLDVSYTNPFQELHEDQHLFVMRTARLAKFGARAGRFTRLMKLPRFLGGMHQKNKEPWEQDAKTARVISNQTNTALSTRVSCLIILMVIVLPLFDIERYPLVDHSMRHWVNEVSMALDDAHGSAEIVELLPEFVKFYSDLDYFPFELKAKFTNHTDALSWSFAPVPKQSYNAVHISSDSGRVKAWFDFRRSTQLDAQMNIMLTVFVILLLMGFSLIMSKSISRIVLQPLEQLLSYLRNTTSTIFKSVTEVANKLVEDEEEEFNRRGSDEAMAVDVFGTETELLMKVVEKLVAVNDIAMKKRDLDDRNDRGNQDLLACCLLPGQPDAPSPKAATRNDYVPLNRIESTESMFDQEVRMASQQSLLMTVGIDIEIILSWRFNALETSDKQNHVAVFSMLKCQGIGDRQGDDEITSNFIAVTSAGYNKQVPYHNWAHAVDVAHAVYQFLRLCEAHRFLNSLELFSLLVSAVGHDLGHFGYNNPFITQTSHVLALRYNDNSPLENMHCTKLFEILRNPKNNLFGGFDQREQRDARNVIIDSILHTDMIHHNGMVQDLQILHEMNSAVFSSGDNGQREEVLIKSKALMRRLLLHAADISNPVKPFNICKAWAHLVLDEFFAQGDAEKNVGIPVQMLNDRDNVSRPSSQIGFIEFLVAPLFFVSAQLLPELQPLAVVSVENAEHWAAEWQTTTLPKPSENEVKDMQDRLGRLGARLREKFKVGVVIE